MATAKVSKRQAALNTIIQRVNVTGGNGCANACGLFILLILLIFIGVPCAGVMMK